MGCPTCPGRGTRKHQQEDGRHPVAIPPAQRAKTDGCQQESRRDKQAGGQDGLLLHPRHAGQQPEDERTHGPIRPRVPTVESGRGSCRASPVPGTLLGRSDGQRDLADTGHHASNPVARHDGTDPFRRTGVDQVAGLQMVIAGQMGD